MEKKLIDIHIESDGRGVPKTVRGLIREAEINCDAADLEWLGTHLRQMRRSASHEQEKKFSCPQHGIQYKNESWAEDRCSECFVDEALTSPPLAGTIVG